MLELERCDDCLELPTPESPAGRCQILEVRVVKNPQSDRPHTDAVDGAAATNAAHQVYFAANVNTAPAIRLITSDGKRLSSRIFGLSYFDAATGKAVLLAEIKDSIGLLLGSNRVVYTNAFDDVDAEVEYLVQRS